MSMMLNPDEEAPPVRADPARMAGLTVRAVDQIGNGAARDIDAVADKLEADAAEGVAKLRRLSDALREHSRIAGDYVGGVLADLADVVSTSRELQSRLDAAARKSDGNGGDCQ